MDKFYSTADWQRVRDQALERDGHRCTVSRLLGGLCSGSLHVHHILPLKTHRWLALDLDNLGTACAGHHAKWDALARALSRTRMTDDLDAAARKAAAVSEAEALARTWIGSTDRLYDALDAVEKKHRVSLGYLEHERIANLSPPYRRMRSARRTRAVARTA